MLIEGTTTKVRKDILKPDKTRYTTIPGIKVLYRSWLKDKPLFLNWELLLTAELHKNYKGANLLLNDEFC